MDWFKSNMVKDKGIIVHTRQPVAYPEVTGYFVPTLYEWGETELARTCTDWLLSVQLPAGAKAVPEFYKPRETWPPETQERFAALRKKG